MKVRYAVALLLALFALLTLFDRFALLELLVLRAGIPLLFALAEALAMLALGTLLRRSRETDAPLDFLLGYPAFGAVCFLAGMLKVAGWTMLPLVLLGALGGALLLVAAWKKRDRETTTRFDAWALPVAVVLGCGFVVAQAPPASLDELANSLAVPRAWVLEGRAVELPLLSHSYFPLGTESADLPPLTVLGPSDGGTASHLLHLLAALAASILIYRRTASWFATAAIATTPALAVAAGWSTVDWPLLGLFVALFVALERDEPRTASAATASGLLTSYVFLPFAIAAWAIRRRRPHWIALLGLLFYLRNLFLTANPLAPYLTAGAPPLFGVRELALADYVFEAGFLAESLGASLLALPLFAAGGVAVAAALLGLVLFLLTPATRVLIPFLATASLSAAPALQRRVLAWIVGLAILIQTFFVLGLTARSGAFALLTASSNEEEYLRKQRPGYASVHWLNETIPAGSRTLVVGLGETYWFSKPVRGGGNLDGPRLSHYLDLPTPEALRARLREDGITHVAVVTAPPLTGDDKRYEQQAVLEPAAQRMLAQTLDRYAATLVSSGNTALFTLR